jgi:hypothetical protein
MFHAFLSSILMLTVIQGGRHIEYSLGPNYSHHKLYFDGNGPPQYAIFTKWTYGAEIGVTNFIQNIGLKIRYSKIRYYTPIEESYEYIPFTLCTSFNLLPFLNLEWLRLSAETGLGIYFWKGYWIDEVIVLPNGEKMEERDIGFVGGLTLQLRPHRYIGVEFASRYNYIASSDLTKYGYYDKDEKIWENGVGIKIIW